MLSLNAWQRSSDPLRATHNCHVDRAACQKQHGSTLQLCLSGPQEGAMQSKGYIPGF